MIDRRRMLCSGGLLALAAAGLGLAAPVPCARERREPRTAHAQRLQLTSLASGDHVDIVWPPDTGLAPATVARVAWVLRDPGTGEQHPIDAALLGSLGAIADTLGVPAAYEVLDGFRSPRRHGTGLHGLGRALDVRLVGVSSARLAAAASARGSGGVGHYRAADFVHLDTGAPRRWSG